MRERSKTNEEHAGLPVRVADQDLRNLATEALVVGFYEDQRPLTGMAGRIDWLLCGALSRLLLAGKLRGAAGDAALLTARGKVAVEKIFLLGLGRKDTYTLDALRNVASAAVAALAGAGVSSAAVEYVQPAGSIPALCMAAFRDAIGQACTGRSLTVTILAPDPVAFVHALGASDSP